MKKNILLNTVFVSAAAAAATAGVAHAQAEGQSARTRDVITVTATKTEQSAQDIPVAVSALDTGDLQELRIDTFSDYLVQLPGVSAGGNGPGQRTIYIRGIASTTPSLTVAGVAGLAPNVAFYLDEQPLAQPGRNLDVYAADLERIEVLPGPQGTLFGASSQAGTVRLITNKPVIGEFEANANFGFSWTDGGEMSSNVTAVVNYPVAENFAVRGVVYADHAGGYIDNVAGTRDLSESARFRSAGTVRSNGVPVAPRRAGFQAGQDLSGVTFLEANNAGRTEEDFNDTTYSGFRVSGRYEFNADWRLDVAFAQQSLDKDGVFFVDPELDDWEIQRYEDDELEDEFTNISWTLEGRVGALETVYTGAYTERNTDQTVDYTDYMFVGQYFPYYVCDGSVTYPGSAAPSGTCQAPNAIVASTSETTVQSHEFRVLTPQTARLRATTGVFYSDTQLDERNDFTYFGSEAADPFGPFVDNYPFQTGYRSDEGPFPPAVIFRNDVRRTDEQLGVFGEVTYDLIPDTLSLIAGARYYDVEVDLKGSANSSFFNSGASVDQQAFGTDISDLYNGDGEYTFRGTGLANQQTFTLDDSVADIIAAGLSPAQAAQVYAAVRAPNVAATDGVITKFTANWTPNTDLLFYATYSEGFRPGLLNRPGGAQGPNGFTVPFALDTDEITNYELGWKTFLFDGALRFNGNVFYIEIEDLQTTIFDPSITNLFFSANAADAEIRGIEGDFNWQVDAVPGLTIAGAFSALDTEITEVKVPTDDVQVGDPLAFAPEFQANLRARYEWQLENGVTAHVMPQLVYSTDSESDVIRINRATVEGYTTLALGAGLTGDRWSVELFGENLTNEVAMTSNNFVFDRERATVMRPRTIGVRFGVQY
ncbi:TonB-dependent receptor [Marinicauda pacifica]|jgi:outer membrane receptor protein involved in Fe transport|uniref:TonB-dependent receptor n=2 Tax=Marinicauda pacifica TaxID=1133559 RepID=A0A4S2H7P7_9PROT|nr:MULTISPECIES: TonB-dependent receptor [Marinicauda]TGY91840.1 TonB-dependent receptor [Marinicauda pacifica]GGE50391.1 TonB-dependent receptor [Marinicauda pacifica]